MHCYGAGAALAVNCDIRLASETATFRFPGAAYGLVVGAAGLPRIVGAARAKEIIFTARTFSAADALRWGFVSALYPPEDLLIAALELADTVAANSSPAVLAAKQVIDAATLSDVAVSGEARANAGLRGTGDQVSRFRTATKRVTGI